MRVLITGGAGTVAGALIAARPPDVEVLATQRRTPVTGVPAVTVDLADTAATDALLGRIDPDLVVHTAYGAVDGARDIVAATGNVATACRLHGARLVHLSTDVVFDGEHAPYAEEDAVAPISEYGRWKAEAEAAVRSELPGAAIVRTSLVIRTDPPDPSSAARLDELRRGRPLALFTDELRCPISCDDLAAGVWEIATLPTAAAAGFWHLVGPEVLSRYAIGVLLAVRAGLPPAFPTALSAEQPGSRPRDLRLTTARADAGLRNRPRPISAVLAPAVHTAGVSVRR